MLPGMAHWNPHCVSLISVFPIRKSVTLKHQGFTEYTMLAADRNKIVVSDPKWLNPVSEQQKTAAQFTEKACSAGTGYTLLKVYDTIQMVYDPVNERDKPEVIPVHLIIDDLIRMWTSGILSRGEYGPGIMSIAGDEPTVEELAAINGRQSAYFTELVNLADGHFMKGDVKNITELHRAAATWLNLPDKPWMKNVDSVIQKDCPACGEKVRMNATVCKHCTTNLLKWYDEIGMRPSVQIDPHIFGVMQMRDEQKKPQAEPKPEPVLSAVAAATAPVAPPLKPQGR